MTHPLTGTVFNIQRSSIHDGPGIRTTVFMKGCPLRCLWCHNPESMSPRPELMLYPAKCIGDGACLTVCPAGARTADGFDRARCVGCGKCADVCYAGAIELAGKTYTVDELFEQARRDKPFYRGGGGVTFSGGEPLAQSEFVAAVAARCREDGISVAVDTALFVAWEAVERLLPYTDLFLVDVKAVTPALHERCTGQPNDRILANLRRLAGTGAPYWVRTPLIPGYNDAPDELRAIGDFLRSLPAPPQKFELMPFHNLCSAKYDALGRVFPAAAVPVPTADELARAYEAVGAV